VDNNLQILTQKSKSWLLYSVRVHCRGIWGACSDYCKIVPWHYLLFGQTFETTCCLHPQRRNTFLLPSRLKHIISSKRWFVFTRLHGVTHQMRAKFSTAFMKHGHYKPTLPTISNGHSVFLRSC
jgi:hypothetical protein